MTGLPALLLLATLAAALTTTVHPQSGWAVLFLAALTGIIAWRQHERHN